MDKIQYRKRCQCLRETLKNIRRYYKISQTELANKLRIPQSLVSKTEIGYRRMDIIELLEYCDAMGFTLTEFAFRLENRLYHEDLISHERKKELVHWLHIYEEYHECLLHRNNTKKKD